MLKIKKNGLTLIEVVLSMFIISVLLVTFITVFGQSAIIVSRGKNITDDTFNYQQIMENEIIRGKKGFIENKEIADYKISIFTKYPYYKSNIDTKEIKTNIKTNRQYTAYITNYEIKEPQAPKIQPFSVEVYDSKGNKAFPWYEDEIKIRANYTLKDNPIIFENRIRWYRSKEGIINPTFSSDYDMINEEIQNEPNSQNYSRELTKDKDNLKPKSFYYFETRPYTLAGRLEHFINDDRILILNKPTNKIWQGYIEDIYFTRDTLKKFNINSKETYIEIMQNPNRATLNLDWLSNENPQGALIGMKIPSTHLNKDFQTKISFQVDSNTLTKSDKLLGVGIGLVNNINTGVIIDFDILKDSIEVYTIENGKYNNINAPIKEIDLITNIAFESFSEKNKGVFDWSKEYKLTIQYFNNENKIKIKLEDDDTVSDFTEVALRNKIEPSHIGLKSYSDINYKPEMEYEIISKYDRNYSSHFYEISFDNLNDDKNFGMFMFGGGLNIAKDDIFGNDKSIYFDSNLNKNNIKNNGHVKVTNIYVKENLEFVGGSHQLGSSDIPGEIHVGGNFVVSGRRNIYGDIFIGKNLDLRDSIIHGNIYVNGDVNLGWGITLSNNTKIYYTGKLTHPLNYNQDILNKLIKVGSLEESKKTSIPELKYPLLKEEFWYRNNNYVSNGNLKNNLKIYSDSYVQNSHTKNVENIIIVAKTGDIRIENFGGSTIKGILFAPYGKVYLNGGNFEGLIIAKNGIDYVQGGGNITIKNIDEIIKEQRDYPFK